MSFFKDHYTDVRYPHAEGTQPGLRKSQIGALHAISSHFTLHDKNCIIAMPTGTGKTAVLMMAAFVLRATRILVITPSRLVRYQIAEDFRELKTLKNIGVFDNSINGIQIKEQNKKLTSGELWTNLEEFDVVVSTPNCCSPAIEGISPPPEQLFDYIFIDEAHHSPSNTWSGVMEAFPNARKILFTATPFRRDKKEIKGSIVYSYPLSKAFQDGSYGKIRYEPVNTVNATDVHIALKAQDVLRADRLRRLQHALMIRTDSKARAKELLRIYEENTSLKVKLIDSSLSYRTIKDSLAKLESQEIDGIICVDMLGEGYNFPNLKIAAIHAPHKSLEVTLQFIGRFSRTAAGVDEAKFIAIPNEIEVEAERIYQEGKAWQDIITNLTQNRIQEEIEKRQTVEGFSSQFISDEALDDLSLFSLKPYFHVKIYKTGGGFDLNKIPDLKKYRLRILRKDNNQDLNTTIFITGEKIRPKWSTVAELENIDYNLFVVYFNETTNLLFINSSVRSEELYGDIAREFISTAVRNLSVQRLNKVLSGLTEIDFFNVGMKNLLSSNSDESYRIIAGSKAHKSVRKSDAQLYGRGHLFATATENGSDITIGLSAASKVWSNQYSGLSDFINWCSEISTKTLSTADPHTGTEIDFLKIPIEVDRLPVGQAIAANWNESAFEDFISIFDEQSGATYNLLDAELVIDFSSQRTDIIAFIITIDDELSFNYGFGFGSDRYFTPIGNDTENIKVGTSERQAISITDYLNSNGLIFFYQNFSQIQYNNLYSPPNRAQIAFDLNQVEVVDWATPNVNIEYEFGPQINGAISIHQFLNDVYLRSLNADFVFYDHGKGEVGDFVVIKVNPANILVQIYHVKASSSAQPGDRVNDVYEVTGQIVRSIRWLNISNLEIQLRYRLSEILYTGTFRRENPDLIASLMLQNSTKKVEFELVLVQPGISKRAISDNIASNLAATHDFCVSQFSKLKVLTSA